MSKRNADDIIEEALSKLSSDRSKLESFLEILEKSARVGEEIDPLAKIALTESVVDVVDALTKNNAQLVLLAQLKAKMDLAQQKPKQEGFSEKETDGMFDEIDQPPNSNGDDDSN